jgi:hypothetical protein
VGRKQPAAQLGRPQRPALAWAKYGVAAWLPRPGSHWAGPAHAARRDAKRALAWLDVAGARARPRNGVASGEPAVVETRAQVHMWLQGDTTHLPGKVVLAMAHRNAVARGEGESCGRVVVFR